MIVGLGVLTCIGHFLIKLSLVKLPFRRRICTMSTDCIGIHGSWIIRVSTIIETESKIRVQYPNVPTAALDDEGDSGERTL